MEPGQPSKILKPVHRFRFEARVFRKPILLFSIALIGLLVLTVPQAHAALSIDGMASYGSTANVSSGSVTLTTTNTNDIIYVFVTLRDNGPTLSSVTATGLTFSFRGSIDNAGNVFSYAYYAIANTALSSATITATLSGGSTRITITAFGISGASAGCPFDPNINGFASATGDSTTPSATISTSTSNDIILGLVGTWIPNGNSPSSFTVGTSFSLIINPYVASTVAGSSNVEGGSEYQVVGSTQTNLAVSATLGTSSQWAMLVDSIQIGGSGSAPCQPIKVTPANGAPSGTGTVSGCNVSPTTIAFDGNQHFFSASASCALTVTVPVDGANTRYRFSGGTTFSMTTCASGLCSSANATVYYQLQNTYGVATAGAGPPTWDPGLTFTFTGTILGTTGQTVCTDSPTSGSITTATCSAWTDYDQTVAAPNNPNGQSQNIRWQISGTSGFTDTTGGNIHNVPYYKQLQNTYQDTPNAQTTWDGSLTGGQPSGTYLGVASSICAITLSSGGGSASCTSWVDFNTTVSIGTISNAPANSRWFLSGVSSWTDTTGGNTHSSNFYKQYTNTFQVTAAAPSKLDPGLALTITGTFAGTPGTSICTITTTNAPTASCSGYSDSNAIATFAATLSGVPSNVQWENSANSTSNTGTITSGANTYIASYFKQLANTYQVAPNAQTAWDSGLSFTLTGTLLGTSGSICAISPAGGTGIQSCTAWADYNTTVSFPADPTGQGPNVRWQPSGALSFTQTTGGNNDNVNYYKQLSNTYEITPNAQDTWDAGLTFTLSGTFLGNSGTVLCTLTPAGGTGAQSCIAWADYNTTESFPTNPTGQSPNTRWQPPGSSSFTQLTGGNIDNVNYYKQLSNTFQTTAEGQPTFDPGLSILLNRTYLGTNSTIILILPSGGAATGLASGWTDYASTVTFPATITGAPENSRWENAANGPNYTPPITTTADTYNVNYYKQWNNTFQITAKAQPNFDNGLTLSINGTYLGQNGSTICIISTSTESTATCSGYSDHGSKVTFAPDLADAPSNSRWESATNEANSTRTITNGGDILNTNYYKQWNNTFKVTPSGPTSFDSDRTFKITGTYLGNASSTICIVSPTSGAGPSSCTGYSDNGSAVTFPASSSGGTSGTNWADNYNGSQDTAPITSGGNTYNANYSLLGVNFTISWLYFLILPVAAVLIALFILAARTRSRKTEPGPEKTPAQTGQINTPQGPGVP
jgi:hypothetical protein